MRRSLLALLPVLWLAAGWGAPAAAHPLGLPGIVRLEVDGATVRSEWVLAGDDETALAVSLGTRAGAPEADELTGDYYAGHFSVVADGATCRPALAPGGSAAIVRGEHRCARPPGRLRVTSSLLLDLDPRYRTLLVVLVGERSERHFLGSATTSVEVGVADEVSRGAALAGPAAEPVSGLPGLERRFVAVVEDASASPAALLAGVAGALVVGAVHALSPGHGKSIAAAYLVGARGRPRDAVWLGVAVAAMHTGSVLALGLATWYATRSVAPGDVVAALRVVAALLVLAVGTFLAVVRTRAWRRGEAVAGHDHDHGHDHSHDAEAEGRRAERSGADDHDHSHDHAPDSPLSRRGLVALGLSGGLLPSPSALVVLLAGLGAGRVPLALGLVAAFSVGLAAAVALVGLAVLKGRDVVAARLPGLRVLPLVAAYAVLLAGILLTITALR